MKKKFITRSAFALLFFVFLFSCKKTDSDFSLSKNNDAVVVENGMLSFSNSEVFSQTIAAFADRDLKEFDKWLSQYSYLSLNSDSLSLYDENEITVYDPLFRRLLNHKRSLKIGNEIFCLKGQNEYLIKDSDLKSYNDIQSNGTVTLSKNIQMRSLNMSNELIAWKNKEAASISAIPSFQGIRGYYSPEYNNGRPERVYMEIYSQSFAVYASQGVLVRGQAYRRGGVFGSKKWREDEMYRARISGMKPLPNTAFGQEPFDTGWIYGQEEVNHTIRRWDASNGTVPANPMMRNLDVTFEYQKGAGNPTGSLYERVN